MTNLQNKPNHLLCIGAGYTAQYVAQEMLHETWSVSGTTRTREKFPCLQEAGITPLLWQGASLLPVATLSTITDILVSTAPNDTACPALVALKASRHHMPALRSVTYFSSTGACGDHGGNWIDETTPTTSTLTRGKARIAAEAAWRIFAAQYDLPVTTLRLSGIYGPGRNAIETLRRQGADAIRVHKPGHVFNRIHVADIAHITSEILHRTSTGASMPDQLFNLADDEPAAPEDVIEFAAGLMGRPLPPLVPYDKADLSPMARSFYAENKKIRNTRIKQALNLTLKYPTYRDGLTALHAGQNPRQV